MRDASQYAQRVPGGVPAEREATAVHLAVRNPRVELEGLTIPWGSIDVGGDAVYAVANHGRWVVNCPDCHGAQLASVSDHRFMCFDCGNAGNDGCYRPVIWPKNHAKIAALLDARPDVTLRNWSPPETVTDLRHENEVLGL